MVAGGVTDMSKIGPIESCDGCGRDTRNPDMLCDRCSPKEHECRPFYDEDEDEQGSKDD